MLNRIALAVSLVAVLCLGGTAFAANSGGSSKNSSSISLVLLRTAAATTSAASTSGAAYGDSVTFSVQTDATSTPFVNLKCYQGGALVAEGWAAFSSGSPAFGLYSPQWTGGAADCTASLDMPSNGKWKQLASTSFHVNA
jgi:hypothetical protein